MKTAATALAILLAALPAFAAEREVTMWKSPTCGCCEGWAEHMRHNGYKVKSVDVDDIDQIKRAYGIPAPLQSCHTAQVDGYLVEGHVPAEAVDRLLKERPRTRGIASPGMPMGSPGMGGPKEENVIRTFGPEGSKEFGRY
ncbi:metal-binding protein [Paramagnetospirillum caucaseum]|uniref:Metal-binding protein n=1 Tax=Paramagnetospirillum caucaseum TaxID=1244869 RepID=M3AHN6_9PROT|nr:DUF411 domain-containing protein [Paramagnetospirillum caucaseum]EME72064.1 metal-binding protein [Paramagnetospirillum caucaseum]